MRGRQQRRWAFFSSVLGGVTPAAAADKRVIFEPGPTRVVDFGEASAS
jgi:hypothetical protein